MLKLFRKLEFEFNIRLTTISGLEINRSGIFTIFRGLILIIEESELLLSELFDGGIGLIIDLMGTPVGSTGASLLVAGAASTFSGSKPSATRLELFCRLY